MSTEALKHVYKFVDDVIAIDSTGDVAGKYHEQIKIARLVVARIAAHPNQKWPPGSMRFLALAAELAVIVLVANRAPQAAQPGLPGILRQLGYEAYELPKSEPIHADEIELQAK